MRVILLALWAPHITMPYARRKYTRKAFSRRLKASRSRTGARRRLAFRRKRGVARRVRRVVNGFPKTNHVALRYTQVVVLNPLAGGVVGYRFRTNSIFDPDLTGVGHKPRGTDEMAAIYSKYVVTGCRMKVTPGVATSDEAATVTGGYYGIQLDDDAVADEVTVEGILERKGNTHTHKMTTLSSMGGGTGRAVTRSIDMKRWFKGNNLYTNDGAWAEMGTNPSEGPNFRVWYGAVSATSNPGSLSFMVELVYDVTCYEPKFMAAS